MPENCRSIAGRLAKNQRGFNRSYDLIPS